MYSPTRIGMNENGSGAIKIWIRQEKSYVDPEELGGESLFKASAVEDR